MSHLCHLAVEKACLVFSSARIKATARGFCSILKHTPDQHPACGLCTTVGHAAAKTTWLRRVQAMGQERERERARLCLLG